MSKKTNLLNKRFGRLLVIAPAKTINGRARWYCLCDCNEVIPVHASHLKSNHTQSCGCLHRENTAKSSKGNIWGRVYEDPKLASAKMIWKISYNDGCSFEKFLELSQLPCFYCNTKACNSNSFNKYLTKDNRYIAKVVNEWADQATFLYNGLDRVDSSKPHNENNIVSCCIICNRAKHSMTTQQFKDWLKRLNNNLFKTQFSPFLFYRKDK
jgi:hypothetical protein